MTEDEILDTPEMLAEKINIIIIANNDGEYFANTQEEAIRMFRIGIAFHWIYNKEKQRVSVWLSHTNTRTHQSVDPDAYNDHTYGRISTRDGYKSELQAHWTKTEKEAVELKLRKFFNIPTY
jgi:hypothetical protein